MGGLIGALGGLLVGIAGSVVKRALLALGIGFVTYVGLSAVISTMIAHVTSSWGSLPANVIAILGLAGISQAVGIVLGAITTRTSMVALSKLGKVQ